MHLRQGVFLEGFEARPPDPFSVDRELSRVGVTFMFSDPSPSSLCLSKLQKIGGGC